LPIEPQLLARDLGASLAGEADLAVAYRRRVEFADAVVTIHAEVFGETGHGGRLHTGLTRLFTHRQQRHVARPFQHITGAGLKLAGHGVKRLDDPVG
jgi:hypothetical protein